MAAETTAEPGMRRVGVVQFHSILLGDTECNAGSSARCARKDSEGDEELEQFYSNLRNTFYLYISLKITLFFVSQFEVYVMHVESVCLFAVLLHLYVFGDFGMFLDFDVPTCIFHGINHHDKTNYN